MYNGHIELIPNVLKPHRPTQYDGESFTVLELTANIGAKMNECIKEYNAFIDEVVKYTKEFTEATNRDADLFQRTIEQKFQDFIGVVELKFSGQTRIIDNAVYHMNTNLRKYIEEVVSEMYESGELDDAIVSAISDLRSSFDDTVQLLNGTIETIDGMCPKCMTADKWFSSGYILKKGQIGVCVPDGTVEDIGCYIKIGDGVKTFDNLTISFNDGMNRCELIPGIDREFLDSHNIGFYSGTLEASLTDVIELLGTNNVFGFNLITGNSSNSDKLQVLFGASSDGVLQRIAYRSYINGKWGVFNAVASYEEMWGIIDNYSELIQDVQALEYKFNAIKEGKVLTNTTINTESGTTLEHEVFIAPVSGFYFIDGYVQFNSGVNSGYRAAALSTNLGLNKVPYIEGSPVTILVSSNKYITAGTAVKLRMAQNSGQTVGAKYEIRYTYMPV